MYQAKIKAVVQEYSEGLVSHIMRALCSPFGYNAAIQRSSKLTAKLSLLRIFISEEELRTRNLHFSMYLRPGGVPT